jgi:hypothetical protein
VVLTLVVLFDALDGRCLSAKGDIHYVATLARAQAHAASGPNFNSGNFQMIERSFFFE